MEDTGLSELGDNLAALAGAGVALPLVFMAAGWGLARRMLGDTPRCGGGTVYIERTCNGIVRHHYRCCCVPPCYGCDGCCT